MRASVSLSPTLLIFYARAMFRSDSLILQFHPYVLVYCLKCSFLLLSSYFAKEVIFWFSRLTSNTTSFYDTNTLNWSLCAPTKSYRMFMIIHITLDSSYLPLDLHINPPFSIQHSLYCELLKGGDSIFGSLCLL